ncbi:MAG: Mu-like prophage major head subunit gpT family protein [Caulobacter sp.]|nr:Mu-like prophage major head subunit gpT family protein [Caulobacter sp.]
MAIITRSTHPSDLWPGIYDHFGNKYKALPNQWGQVFEKGRSTKAYEQLVETTTFGLASVKPEGQSIVYDVDAEGYKTTLTHVVYGLGYIVTREENEDNQYLEVSKRRSANLAYSMRTTAEYVHWNILNRAFSTSYPIGDGAALVSAAHPTMAGNASNLLTAADLSETSLEDAMKLIMAAKNSRGLPIAVGVRRIIVPVSEAFNAQRILKTNLRPGTANNDINAIKAMGLVPEVVVSNYLTDPDAFFIQTDIPDGLMSLWRREVELEQDNDFDTENLKAKATMRFAAGIGDWRAIWGNAGA